MNLQNVPPECEHLVNNRYKFIYSCNFPYDTLVLGALSFALALLNIISISVMSIAVLKVVYTMPLSKTQASNLVKLKSSTHSGSGGALEMTDMKMQDMKIAGHEIAEVQNIKVQDMKLSQKQQMFEAE